MTTWSTASNIMCSDCGRGPLWNYYDCGWGPICLACYHKAHAAPAEPTEPQDIGSAEEGK